MSKLRIFKIILMMYFSCWWFRRNLLEEIVTLPVLITCLTTRLLLLMNCRREGRIKLSIFRKIFMSMLNCSKDRSLRRSKNRGSIQVRRNRNTQMRKMKRRSRNPRKKRRHSSNYSGRKSCKMTDGQSWQRKRNDEYIFVINQSFNQQQQQHK